MGSLRSSIGAGAELSRSIAVVTDGTHDNRARGCVVGCRLQDPVCGSGDHARADVHPPTAQAIGFTRELSFSPQHERMARLCLRYFWRKIERMHEVQRLTRAGGEATRNRRSVCCHF
jgi:hypothetical protein